MSYGQVAFLLVVVGFTACVTGIAILARIGFAAPEEYRPQSDGKTWLRVLGYVLISPAAAAFAWWLLSSLIALWNALGQV